MTPDSAPTSTELPANVSMVLTEKGGHVGFVGGGPNQLKYWLEERTPCFLLDKEPEPQSYNRQ